MKPRKGPYRIVDVFLFSVTGCAPTRETLVETFKLGHDDLDRRTYVKPAEKHDGICDGELPATVTVVLHEDAVARIREQLPHTIKRVSPLSYIREN